MIKFPQLSPENGASYSKLDIKWENCSQVCVWGGSRGGRTEFLNFWLIPVKAVRSPCPHLFCPFWNLK